MNKQEAINAICDLKIINGMVSRYAVVSIVNQIEPQKPVIPQFVADWIEYARAEGYSLYGALEMVGEDSEIFNWLFNGHKSNQETFAQAWIFGYEIEQTQLYTVEIPNPNGKGRNRFYLLKDVDTGRVMLGKGNFNPKKNKTLWLTEAEIKQDFEWAWDAGFAKEAEM